MIGLLTAVIVLFVLLGAFWLWYCSDSPEEKSHLQGGREASEGDNIDAIMEIMSVEERGKNPAIKHLLDESLEQEQASDRKDIVHEVVRSSAEQSRSMLYMLMRLEQERDELKRFLETTDVKKEDSFRSLANIPEESDDTAEALYTGLQGKNKELKERLYKLERENLYLREMLSSNLDDETGKSEAKGTIEKSPAQPATNASNGGKRSL